MLPSRLAVISESTQHNLASADALTLDTLTGSRPNPGQRHASSRRHASHSTEQRIGVRAQISAVSSPTLARLGLNRDREHSGTALGAPVSRAARPQRTGWRRSLAPVRLWWRRDQPSSLRRCID